VLTIKEGESTKKNEEARGPRPFSVGFEGEVRGLAGFEV
jgi:hypothetical protein